MAHPPPPPQLHSLPSFSHAAPADADRDPAASDAASASASDDDGSDAGFEFEFAFAPPLAEDGAQSDADDLFAHGRILPAYPVFDRALLHLPRDADADADAAAAASTAPPSPDTYCAWAPRSAPGSPARGHPAPFPKSASTGEERRWRLRDLVAGRSHSDGKEKFLFLQTGNAAPTAAPPKISGKARVTEGKQSATRPSPPQKQSKKTTKAAGVTEMDMATAHRLFYAKQPGAAAGAGADRRQHSYLPYRPGIVGFFASAHALGRSHHPY